VKSALASALQGDTSGEASGDTSGDASGDTSDVADADADAGSSPTFLQKSSSSQMSAGSVLAGMLLEMYAEVIPNVELGKLAESKLTVAKLQSVGSGLRAADQKGSKPTGPEKSCAYFQGHAQTAAPVLKAAHAAEAAKRALTEALSRQTALVEEQTARSQLQKAVQKDLESLNTLLTLAKEGVDGTPISAMQFVRDASAELQDVVSMALEKRSAVAKEQGSVLEGLSKMITEAGNDVKQSQLVEKQAAVDLETAQKQVASIQSACTAEFQRMDQQRRPTHVLAHAVNMAVSAAHGSQ